MTNLNMVNVFSKLRPWQKFTCISVLLGGGILFITWNQVKATSDELSSSRKALGGIEYLSPLHELYQQVTKHRDLVLASKGNPQFKEQSAATEQAINTAFLALSEMDTRFTLDNSYGALFETIDKIPALKRDWDTIRNKSAQLENHADVLERHTKLISALSEVMIQVAEKSNLMVAPELDARYLLDVITKQLPQTVDIFGQARGQMMGMAKGGELTAPEKSQLDIHLALSLKAFDNLEYAVRRASAASSLTGGEFGAQYQQTTSTILREARMYLKKSETSSTDQPVQRFHNGTKIADGLFQINDSSLKNLNGIINNRISLLASQRNTDGGIGLATFLISLLIAYLVARSNSAPALASTEATQFSAAESEATSVLAKAPLIADEDKAQTAAQNISQEEFLQQRSERDALQKSIQRLVEEVKRLTSGDLTRRAAVAEDITADLATAFNAVSAELSRFVTQVKTLSNQVSSVATTTEQNSEERAQRIEQQTKQFHHTSQLLQEISTSIQTISNDAQQSVTLTRQAFERTQNRLQAMSTSLHSLSQFNGQTQETARQAQRLNECTTALNELSQFFEDIGDQTSFLAINASIQAAAAGEGGRGFAVIADEIERLSRRFAQHSATVFAATKTIQVVSQDIISTLNTNADAVTDGAGVTEQVEHTINEIEGLSNRLVEMLERIAETTQQQTQNSETLSQSLNEISSLVEETTAGLTDATSTARNLNSLAEEMRASISLYKLPE